MPNPIHWAVTINLGEKHERGRVKIRSAEKKFCYSYLEYRAVGTQKMKYVQTTLKVHVCRTATSLGVDGQKTPRQPNYTCADRGSACGQVQKINTTRSLARNRRRSPARQKRYIASRRDDIVLSARSLTFVCGQTFPWAGSDSNESPSRGKNPCSSLLVIT